DGEQPSDRGIAPGVAVSDARDDEHSDGLYRDEGDADGDDARGERPRARDVRPVRELHLGEEGPDASGEVLPELADEVDLRRRGDAYARSQLVQRPAPDENARAQACQRQPPREGNAT